MNVVDRLTTRGLIGAQSLEGEARLMLLQRSRVELEGLPTWVDLKNEKAPN